MIFNISPPKHYINFHNTSRSRPPVHVLLFAVFTVVCFLFLTKTQFNRQSTPDLENHGVTNYGVEVLGPKPYFIGIVDEKLKDVQNETLGVRLLE